MERETLNKRWRIPFYLQVVQLKRKQLIKLGIL